MNALSFTEYLVKSVVKNPDMVSVKEFEENNELIIEIMVDNEDMSLVIGKRGTIIESIRTIVKASSYVNNGPKVKINIDSI